MTSIKLTVTGAHAWALVTGPLTSGMVGIPVTIEYDEAWDGLTKNLMCRCSPWGSDNGEVRAILNVGENAAVAHEVMQTDMYLYLGVEGFSGDGQLVIPTIWARCGKIEYGANTCEDPSTDPELPVWNQLQTEMKQIKESALTQEQAAEIQTCAQEAVQAAQEARQAADEAKQAANVGGSGLYYTPVVTQPTTDTLKFEFNPSVIGAPVPNPVTVELPVSEDSGQNLSLNFEGTKLSLDSDGERLSEVDLPTIPTPVHNPRTNCILTAAGAEKMAAGVILWNPGRSTTLSVDINFELLSGSTTEIRPWIYAPFEYAVDSNSIKHVADNQVIVDKLSYTEGSVQYTFSATDDKIDAEYVALIFYTPGTGLKWKITFNDLGDFEIVRTVRHETSGGPMDILRLDYAQEYSSVRLLSRWAGKRYLALGDSITDGDRNDPDYPGLLKDILGLSVVDNLGKSGEHMANVGSNNAIALLKSWSYDYDLISIMLGVNDFRNANVDVGDPTATAYDTATYAGAYRTVLDYIIANNPRAMIVLIQPIWYSTENTPDAFGKTLEDYREAVRQIAKIYNLPTVDLRTGFSSHNSALFYEDGLHLNADGEMRMADILGQFLCTV